MSSEYKEFLNFSSKYKAIKHNDNYYLIKKSVPISTINFNKLKTVKKSKYLIHISNMSLSGFILFLTLFLYVFNNNYIIVYIASSLILHELSHVLIGEMIDVSNLRFGFKITNKFFPIVFINAENIYEKTRLQRILYYSAGITMNLMIVLFILIFNIDAIKLLKINFWLLVYNAFPLLFTDGFNILKEITQVYDLRSRVIKSLTGYKSFVNASKMIKGYIIFLIINIILLSLNILISLKYYL